MEKLRPQGEENYASTERSIEKTAVGLPMEKGLALRGGLAKGLQSLWNCKQKGNLGKRP